MFFSYVTTVLKEKTWQAGLNAICKYMKKFYNCKKRVAAMWILLLNLEEIFEKVLFKENLLNDIALV